MKDVKRHLHFKVFAHTKICLSFYMYKEVARSCAFKLVKHLINTLFSNQHLNLLSGNNISAKVWNSNKKKSKIVQSPSLRGPITSYYRTLTWWFHTDVETFLISAVRTGSSVSSGDLTVSFVAASTATLLITVCLFWRPDVELFTRFADKSSAMESRCNISAYLAGLLRRSYKNETY